MLRDLIRKGVASSLRKEIKVVPKVNAKTPVEKKETKDLLEDDKFNQAKMRILKKYRDCTIYDLIEEGYEVEKLMNMEYKKYPYHIDHWNPESDHYVESPLEEQRMHKIVDSHNEIIDQFKNSLKIQKEVMERIRLMDRPYLKSGELGNTRNIYNPVKNYAQTEGLLESDLQKSNTDLLQFQNEKMFVNNIPFHANIDKAEIFKEMEVINENAPVNHHPNPKGYKFDVETPYEERYPHLADRLGHPEIFLSPLETLFRFDRILTHPNFVDQPFIQVPKAEPDEDVNFTAGEVLYENSHANEWSRLLIYTSNLFHLFTFAYVPLHTVYSSYTAPMSVLRDLSIYFIYKDPRVFDSLGIFPLTFTAVYLASLFINNLLMFKIVEGNIGKIQYNQDKDLIFVKSIGMFGIERNSIYEMDHLEIVPSHAKTSTASEDFSEEGMMRVNCLNTFNTLNLHNHSKYWNNHLKENFLKNVTRLRDKNYVEDGIYEKFSD